VQAIEPAALELERGKRHLEVEAQLLRVGSEGQADIEIVVEAGAAHRMLLEVADSRGVDLLVVGGSESHGPLAPLLGSTADRVLRKASCPILIVRGDRTLPPKSVLAPVDLSTESEMAFGRGLAMLDQWSEGSEVEVEALFVLSKIDREASPFAAEQVDRFAVQQVSELIARARGDSGAIIRPEVRVGFPREEILQCLDERPVDLVLLSTHGGGGFERLLLGSVAASVSHRARTSVLFLPPQITA
jgi:nucleotide-binding universal stress UspA family protein